jgi:cold shock CspA family protein
MIRITRESGYADVLRAYKVVLDGKVIGTIRDGQQVEFDVAPGRHQLQLKIDWCRSNIVDFEVDGGTVEFECGSNVGGCNGMMAIYYVVFLSGEYLWLRVK